MPTTLLPTAHGAPSNRRWFSPDAAAAAGRPGRSALAEPQGSHAGYALARVLQAAYTATMGGGCWWKPAIVAVMGAMLGGCSWLFVKPPPAVAYAPPRDVECTESLIAPVVDTALAVASVALGTFAIVDACDDCEYRDMSILIGATMAPPAVAFSLSASHGYASTAACREASAAASRPRPVRY